jgi:hypothetical protein
MTHGAPAAVGRVGRPLDENSAYDNIENERSFSTKFQIVTLPIQVNAVRSEFAAMHNEKKIPLW